MHCRHHPACPGCPLLDRPYDAQLTIKRERLVAAFAAFGHLPPVPEVAPSRWTEGYRHRLKLPVQVSRDRVAVGLYDRTGKQVLDTPDCPVLTPSLREALGIVRGWLRGRDGVHSVDLRVSSSTGALQLVLATVGAEIPGGPRALRDLRRRLPALVSIAVSRADPERRRVMGRSPRVVEGAESIPERIGSTGYNLTPGAFFQVDPRQASALHERVARGVAGARTVLDLYAGVGAYGRMLAPSCERVVMVEEVPQAAAAARLGAPRQATVLTGRVEDVAPEGPFDAVVLNPARRGADLATLARLGATAKRLVYVSCGPETLARDLDVLAFHGLRVVSVEPVDLFPQTPEVETVVTLERGERVLSWPVRGGRARGPWGGGPSGAEGRPTEVVALVLGNTGLRGRAGRSTFTREAVLAGHSLVRIRLAGPLSEAISSFQASGHAVAGHDPRTASFFAEKAGLVRPFVHVSRAGNVEAPLHGDLMLAKAALRA